MTRGLKRLGALGVLLAFTVPAASAAGAFLDDAVVLVPPDGREAFTPAPLDPGSTYRMTVTGVVQMAEVHLLYEHEFEADAVYVSDTNGSKRRWPLEFNTWGRLIEENRARRRYVFELRGHGKQLGLRFARGDLIPNCQRDSNGYCQHQALQASITRMGAQAPLPWWEYGSMQVVGGTVGIVGLLVFSRLWVVVSRNSRSREQERRHAERERVEAEQRQRELEVETERARNCETEEREQLFAELVARYELLPHLEDPIYLAQYAASHAVELLCSREEILDERARLHADTELTVRLRDERPAIYRRISWRVHALALAEVADVTPLPPPPLPPPPETPQIDHLDYFPHRTDPTFIERYARAHLDALLRERHGIIDDFRELQDIPELQRDHPERYQRELYRLRALAVAEQLAVEPKPIPVAAEKPAPSLKAVPEPTPRLTPEEWRVRMLRRKREKLKDLIAEKALIGSTLSDVRKLFEQLGLTDEVREDTISDVITAIRGFDDADREVEES